MGRIARRDTSARTRRLGVSTLVGIEQALARAWVPTEGWGQVQCATVSVRTMRSLSWIAGRIAHRDTRARASCLITSRRSTSVEMLRTLARDPDSAHRPNEAAHVYFVMPWLMHP